MRMTACSLIKLQVFLCYFKNPLARLWKFYPIELGRNEQLVHFQATTKSALRLPFFLPPRWCPLYQMQESTEGGLGAAVPRVGFFLLILSAQNFLLGLEVALAVVFLTNSIGHSPPSQQEMFTLTSTDPSTVRWLLTQGQQCAKCFSCPNTQEPVPQLNFSMQSISEVGSKARPSITFHLIPSLSNEAQNVNHRQ